MTARTLVLVGLGMTTMFGLAQAPPVMDYEARVKSVANLKEHIAQREARFELMKTDLIALDARVEKQIDSIVKTLASMKDSNDTKTGVANIKDDVMRALVKMIYVYRQKRMEVFDQMRKDTNVPQDQVDAAVKVFDDRIGKRIAQVMELARSFPGAEDVEKYESAGGSYWRGFYQENTRVSEEWKQNQRAETSGRGARQDVLKVIDKALATNQNRRAALADTVAKGKLNERQRALQQEELGRTDALIDNLKAQKRDLVLPAGGGTREIGNDELVDAGRMLDDARRDLSRDFYEIMGKYTDLSAERTRLFALKQNLAAREEWLQKNPPPSEKKAEGSQ